MDLSYQEAISVEEYCQRRERLLQQLSDNAALVVFSNQEQRRNADNHYPFRQDSYFWYLTGFNEPDSVLLLTKKAGKTQSAVFVRPSDPLMETWNGRRLGVESAPEHLYVDNAYSIEDIDLILCRLLSGYNTLYHAFELQPWGDSIVNTVLSELRQHSRKQLQVPYILTDWRPLVDEMRLFKSAAEIALLQQAGQISALAHLRAMKTCRPNRFEYELEHEMLHEFSRFGARYAAYNTIVAGGENACILHYTENNALLMDGDLVLIDGGAEFAMYAGDISRTFPINGKFTEAQRAIYDIVLQAEQRAIELLVPGATIQDVNLEVIRIKLMGLQALGIIHGDLDQLIKDRAYLSFYMHGLGHWLGLDVHDVGNYGNQRDRALSAGMVLTVEPGIYLNEQLDIPQEYKGIGIRIEDNILITETGNKVLTAAVPKEPDMIERIMQEQ